MSCDHLKDAVTQKLAVLQTDLTKRSEVLSASFKEEAKGIDPNINTDGPDAWISADVKIEWKTVEFSLDLPEIKMVDQEWSLDLPEITVKDQHIIFDLPAVRMETQKTGEYPEFYCDTSSFIPKCTVRWSPMYADLPVQYMERHDILIGIPEFKMGRASFILGVPEVTMKTSRFSLDLPEVTVKNIQIEAASAREKAQNLSARAKTESDHLRTNFTQEAKMLVGSDVNLMFDCYHSELQSRKNDTVAMFMSGEASIRAGINSMIANKVPDDHAMLVALREQLTALVEKSTAFTSSIANQFADLDEQRQKFVKNVLGG